MGMQNGSAEAGKPSSSLAGVWTEGGQGDAREGHWADTSEFGCVRRGPCTGVKLTGVQPQKGRAGRGCGGSFSAEGWAVTVVGCAGSPHPAAVAQRQPRTRPKPTGLSCSPRLRNLAD